MRRRLYLMRHAQVAYFVDGGRPVDPHDVPLTGEGRAQARAAAEALAGVRLDRVITSGLPRTIETARIVAPGIEPETWPEFREIEGGRLQDIAEDELEAVFKGAFRGDVPEQSRFLGGETLGSLLDRVVPAVQRLLEEEWDALLAVLHGAVNRAILSFALTSERRFLGGFEQAPACINVLDVGESGWIVRAVNSVPYDLVHARGRATTMEELYEQYLPWRAAEGT